ncbi:hypothetical protein SD81_031235 [Tolypothrix campylonemoides VB511288]|nr:hypothetical protein SD81_031235 [Tolypothrix campylonemoides VB511288]
MKVFKTAINTLVSKEGKLNNTNLGFWEFSEELDDADLVGISGGISVGSLVNIENINIGDVSVLSGNGSQNGGYNTTSNTQNAYTSVNNTNTTDTSTTGN